MRLLAFILIGFLGLAQGAFAADDDIYSSCALHEAGDANFVDCSFRTFEPKTVKRVSVFANGEALNDANFTSFDDGNDKAAWLFLIDRSNPRRAKTVQRSIDLVKELYAKSNARNIMSVATFAGDLQVLVSPGDPYADIDARLKDVKADGAATAFYQTALKGIEILEKVPAERRALVIISDGKAEDTAYEHSDVVKKAKDAGVVIYGIGFAERAAETVDLQQIERLASETGGPFASAVGDEPLPAKFVENFSSYLTNGGDVSALLGHISGEIEAGFEVAFTDGTSKVSETAGLYVEPKPEPVVEEPPPPPPPLPLIGKI